MPKHIHRYQRIKLGKDYIVYRCNLPTCNHYLSRDMVKGKVALCNRCGGTMIMGALQLSLAKPHCMGCVKSKDEGGRIRKLLEALG